MTSVTEYLKRYHQKFIIKIETDENHDPEEIQSVVNLKISLDSLPVLSANIYNDDYSNIAFTDNDNHIFKYEYYKGWFYIRCDYLTNGLIMHVLPKEVNNMDYLILHNDEDTDAEGIHNDDESLHEYISPLRDVDPLMKNIQIDIVGELSRINVIGLLDSTNTEWDSTSLMLSKLNTQKNILQNAKKEDDDEDYEFNIDNNYVFSEYDMEDGFPETLLDNEKYVSTLKYISEDLFVDTHAEYYIERQLNCYPQTSTFTKWKEENEIPLSAYQDTDEVEE